MSCEYCSRTIIKRRYEFVVSASLLRFGSNVCEQLRLACAIEEKQDGVQPCMDLGALVDITCMRKKVGFASCQLFAAVPRLHREEKFWSVEGAIFA